MAEKKLNDLFLDTLKDIYFAERQILKNLPKLAKAAKSAELKKAFLTHRDQTEQHVERLQEVFELIGRRPQAKTCEAIKGILEEGEEIMEEYTGSEVAGRRPARRRPGGRALRDVALRHPENLGQPARAEKRGQPARRNVAGRKANRRPAEQPGGVLPSTRKPLSAGWPPCAFAAAMGPASLHQNPPVEGERYAPKGVLQTDRVEAG